MSVWDWVYSSRDQARRAGDQERIRLNDLFAEASRSRYSAPDQALILFARGRALAQQLGEPWWVLLCDHWRLQTLIYAKQDFDAALDLAARCAVEVRKPAYAQLPQRVCLHEDLILAYIGRDPMGHARLIDDALDYMGAEIAPQFECRYCLQELRATFELERGRPEQATEAALRLLAMSPEARRRPNHYRAVAYALLCRIACHQSDWEALLTWAREGEEASRSVNEQDKVAEFLAWQALATRRLSGDKLAAQRSYRLATTYAGRLGATPHRGYFDALSAYHALDGQLERALQVRRQQLAAIAGKGQLTNECRCRVACCQIRAQLGEPLDVELAGAREAAAKLADPTPFLVQLDRIARGDPPHPS